MGLFNSIKSGFNKAVQAVKNMITPQQTTQKTSQQTPYKPQAIPGVTKISPVIQPKSLTQKIKEAYNKAVKKVQKTVNPHPTAIKFKDENIRKYEASHPFSKRIISKVEEHYGFTPTSCIKVKLKIDGDQNSINKYPSFGIYIPYEGKGKMDIKQIMNEMHSQAKTFYDNLAKKYNKSYDDAMDNLDAMMDEINSTMGGLSEDDVYDIAENNGIEFGGIELDVWE